MLALENFIKECTNSQAAIFGFLREIILSCAPDIEEEMRDATPYYHFNGGVCYINNHGAGTELSFCNGHELYDPSGVLLPAERYEEKKLRFISIREVNPEVVLPILRQAISVNRVNSTRLVLC